MGHQNADGFQNCFLSRIFLLPWETTECLLVLWFQYRLSAFLCWPSQWVYKSINHLGYFHFTCIKADSRENYNHCWDWKSRDDEWVAFYEWSWPGLKKSAAIRPFATKTSRLASEKIRLRDNLTTESYRLADRLATKLFFKVDNAVADRTWSRKVRDSLCRSKMQGSPQVPAPSNVFASKFMKMYQQHFHVVMLWAPPYSAGWPLGLHGINLSARVHTCKRILMPVLLLSA